MEAHHTTAKLQAVRDAPQLLLIHSSNSDSFGFYKVTAPNFSFNFPQRNLAGVDVCLPPDNARAESTHLRRGSFKTSQIGPSGLTGDAGQRSIPGDVLLWQSWLHL